MRASVRERRLVKVDDQVLRHYRFARLDADDTVRVSVSGGAAPYEVTASRTWAHPPTCSCPDAQRPEVRGYCKHTLAVLTLNEDLACQLLEVYL